MFINKIHARQCLYVSLYFTKFFLCFQFLCHVQRNPSHHLKTVRKNGSNGQNQSSNSHHPIQKILFPAKFHINPHWGNFYRMLLFSFQKGLNGQNHSSSVSHNHIKIPFTSKFSISPMGRYPPTLNAISKTR